MPGQPGRPDSAVGGPGSGFDMARGFQVMIESLTNIESSIARSAREMATAMQAQTRYAMAGGGTGASGAAAHAAAGQMYNQTLPQVRQDVLRRIAQTGGMNPEHMTAGMTKVTPGGALSSLENLQRFTAQRFGEMLAGPIYEQPGSAQPGQTVSAPGGGTGQVDPVAAAYGALGGTGPWQGAAGVQGPGTAAGQAQAAMAGASSAAGASAAAAGAGTGGPAAGAAAGAAGAALGGLAARVSNPRIAGALTNLGHRIALSGGTGQGLLGSITRLPGVGLGLDIAGRIADIYQGQREAARPFQEAEGGTNLSAQTERLHQLGYQVSMLGLMPEGAAASAFGAVTGMGYSQAAYGQASQMQNRQSALDFIYHNYTARGMDVQDSVKILETASQSAVVSLQGISTALGTLSNIAGAAGTNAQNARDNFNALLGTAIGAGAAGGAPALAGGLAATQAAYGQPFAGANFAGELGAGQQYMIAGKYGISPSQVQYLMRTQPQEYARMLAGSHAQILGAYLQPGEAAGLQQMIAQAGGGRAMTPALAQQIGTQFLNRYQAQNPNLNTNILAQVINQQTGLNLTPGNVMQWIVEQQAGNTEAAHTPSVASAPVRAARPGGAVRGRYGLALPRAGGIGLAGPDASAKAGTASAPGTWQQALEGASGGAQAAGYYLRGEQRTGMRSPVLEGLLQNASAGDQVAVQTRSGPRVMSFTDAMRYYPDELASGNVTFYRNGRALGGTATLTRGNVDPGIGTLEEQRQQAGSRLGVTQARYSRAHPAPASGAGGTVTVNLSQEAKKLLTLLPSTSDQAAATSSVPASPYVIQGSR
jgi:hypothetical protein